MTSRKLTIISKFYPFSLERILPSFASKNIAIYQFNIAIRQLEKTQRAQGNRASSSRILVKVRSKMTSRKLTIISKFYPFSLEKILPSFAIKNIAIYQFNIAIRQLEKTQRAQGNRKNTTFFWKNFNYPDSKKTLVLKLSAKLVVF